MGSFGTESELVLHLIEAGNHLLNPPPSTDGLLSLLDDMEILLSNVEQDPSTSMQDALLPSLKALIAADFLRHPDDDVRVSVVSCLTEIMRITAPEAPYDDEHMKEIFKLTVDAFGKLSDMSSRSYRKAELVLDTVSRVRSCLLMLDLECNELILEMFRCFLKTISSNHPQVVVLAAESIMSMVIDESEEVSKDLLDVLLGSVRKENENVLSMAWMLAEKVLSRCTCKFKPYVMEALESAGHSLDMYSPVVSSICHSEASTAKEHVTVNAKEKEGALDLGQSSDTNLPKNTDRPPDDGCRQTMSARNRLTDKNDSLRKGRSRSLVKHCSMLGHSRASDAETKSMSSPKKRGWKPNSLMNPEEGYDHAWISRAKGSFNRLSSNKLCRKRVRESSLGNPVPKKASFLKEAKSLSPKTSQTAQTMVMSLQALNSSLRGPRKRSRPKNTEMCGDINSLTLSKRWKEASSIQVGKEGLPSLNAAIKTEQPEEEYLMTPSQKGVGESKDNKKAVKLGKKVNKTASKEPVKEVKTNQRRTVVPSDAKTNMLQDTTLHQCSPGSSRCKNVQVKTGPSAEESEETPKSNLTRKRSARKELGSETPWHGEELVGKRIKVWWPLDKMFYEGVVDSYDNVRKRHRVSYSDGDMEVLCLKRQRWELIEDDASTKLNHQQNQETNLPESSTSSEVLERRKVSQSKKTSATGKTTDFSEGRSSKRTSKKKGVGKELNKQVKRVEDGVIRKTIGTLKAESEEPETKEGESLKSLKEFNSEPEEPKLDTDKKQNVTLAMPEKKEEEEEVGKENQELEIREEDDQKSVKPGDSTADSGSARDVTVMKPSDAADTSEEKATEGDAEKNTGVCESEIGQARKETRNLREPNAESETGEEGSKSLEKEAKLVW